MKKQRTLLESRFNLRFHRQTKKLRVYVLTAAKGGPRLDENKDGPDLEAQNSGAGSKSIATFPCRFLQTSLTQFTQFTQGHN